MSLLSGTLIVHSQDSTSKKKVKILPVPAVGYTPETRTYIGVVSLFTLNPYDDTVTRTSNAKVEMNYTWNKQLVVEAGWNYFFKDEKWFSKGLLHFSKYPDLYYGIGPNTPEGNKLVYNSNRTAIDIAALKKIGPDLFAGPNTRFMTYSNVEQDSLLPSYAELRDHRNFGIGASLLKDSRNSILTPLNGVYASLNITYNFSESNYFKTGIDLRYYKTFKEKYTIASRFLNDLNFGAVPFYDMAILGGDKFVRGYYYGRFRDKNLSSLQSEFRMPVVWRFGFAAFGGLSNLYSKQNAFDLKFLKYNYGLGLRFLVDRKENTNLRVDYALGEKGNNGFYIAFGESF